MVHLCTLPNSHFRILSHVVLPLLFSSRAVGGVPTSVFYPVVTWVLLLVVLAYWAVVALYPTIYRNILVMATLHEQMTLPHFSTYMYIPLTIFSQASY